MKLATLSSLAASLCLLPILAAQAETPISDSKTNAPVPIITNNISDPFLRVYSGAIVLNPYKVVDSTGAGGDTIKSLEKDSSSAHFFVEVSYDIMWAWSPSRRYGSCFVDEQPQGNCKYFGLGKPDFQGRLIYVAGGEKNTNAATMIGSGDLGVELTLGIPIYRSLSFSTPTDRHTDVGSFYDRTTGAHWLGIVASFVAVTDSSSFDIHNRYLLGAGYRGAIKTPWQKGEDGHIREANVSFTLGAAGVETVEYINKQDRQVKFERDGVLAYHTQPALAIEGEIHLPVSQTANVVAGTRLYNGLDSDTWNAYVALTVPFEKITSIFGVK